MIPTPLYFLTPFIILSITFLLNSHYKWITKQNFYEITDIDPEEDMFMLGIWITFFIIAWPLFLFLIILFGITHLIPKIIYNIIPNDKSNNTKNTKQKNNNNMP